MKKGFDLVIIGGGSGGSACAKRAAGYGKKVAIIERGPSRDSQGLRHGGGFGGTCVNVGCVPKKLMFLAAQQRENMVGHVSLSEGFGYTVPESAGKFDWAGVKARRDKYVAGLNKGYASGWEKLGITVVEGVASFVNETTVSVALNGGGTQTLEAPHILVACGGKPKLPDIPGAELAISSDGFFDIETQPKKAAVFGAGYIAVEMAGILHALGSESHLFFRGDTVLRRGFDPFIVDTLMAEMEEHGPTLHKNASPSAISKAADGTLTVEVKVDGKYTQLRGFDCVLMAIGREPIAKTLGLEKAGVATNAAGFITVDEYERTSAPSVLAIGDCTSTGYELTPVAIAAGRRLGDRLYGGEPRARIEYGTIATVVFSHPPIGTIGLTELQAVEEFGAANVTTKQARFASMLYAFNADAGKVKTGLKLVLAGPEERVVGLHAIGPYSDEMLQGFAVAVRMGATRADFEASVAIHPTVAEEMVTFGGWGQDRDSKPVLPPYLREAPAADGIGLKRLGGAVVLGAVAGGLAVACAMGKKR